MDEGRPCSYGDLQRDAWAWSARLTEECREGGEVLRGQPVAYLVPPGRTHVALQLGIWAAGAIAVPLALSHPLRELEYILDDARPRVVVVDSSLAQGRDLASAATARAIDVVASSPPPPSMPPARTAAGSAPTALCDRRGHPAAPELGDPTRQATATPALIIYTSGTTGRPKGVLTTHRNLTAQITALTTAWEWTATDRILHTLPLHHIHGVVNALACALWSGASCEFGSARPQAIWERFAAGGITLFMSVPTVYRRLIQAWEEAPAERRNEWSRGARGLRLMVSGSAALPVATLERWREITGHTLLERYGMTEIGMALSNPLRGERRPGHVGTPLPGVELRIVGEDGRPVSAGEAGEIEVRGAQVFCEYRGRPEETAAAFRDGWFRTGDEACRGADGVVRILGRSSVDIVKTGGYKVSALEIEEIYRTHPRIADLAVVGFPHPDWGEQLRAAWVPAGGTTAGDAPGSLDARADDSRAAAHEPAAETNVPTPTAAVSPTSQRSDSSTLPGTAALRAWGKERLAPYKVPHRFLAIDALPRNAMGKVRKPEVARILMDAAAGHADVAGTSDGAGTSDSVDPPPGTTRSSTNPSLPSRKESP